MRLFIALFLCLLPSPSFSYIFSTSATNAIIMDYNSDTVIFEHAADERMHPSSMSKLMNIYIAFSKLKSGIIKMTDIYTVSTAAWKIGGSSMFLEPEQAITVEDLLQGMIIVSGNDAAITFAEGASGSQENFIKEMNNMAEVIGLHDSHFSNISGLTDDKHFMSSRDLLKLAIKIFEDFPEYYYLFSEKEFTYNKIYQPTTNELLWSNLGVDGIKTGTTKAGGFGVTLSSEQNGRRIFAVINGLKNKAERRKDGIKLLQYVFNNFNNKVLFKAGDEIVKVNVWFGREKFIPLVVHDDILITYKRGNEGKINVTANYHDIAKAPIIQNQRLGTLKICIPEQKEKEIPLYAKYDVLQLNPIQRLFRKIEMVIGLK